MWYKRIAGLSLYIAAAMAIITPVVVAEPGDDPAEQRLKALTDRIKRIEDSIGMRDGQTLVPAISDRLKRGEDDLAEIERRFEDAGTGLPERQLEQMQQQLKKSVGDLKDVESRLAAVESQKRTDDNLAREIRQISSELRGLQVTLSDLERRLAKLEAK